METTPQRLSPSLMARYPELGLFHVEMSTDYGLQLQLQRDETLQRRLRDPHAYRFTHRWADTCERRKFRRLSIILPATERMLCCLVRRVVACSDHAV